MKRPSSLRRLLRGLTPSQRKVLYMRFELRRSFREIARECGFRSVSTAYQHYSYALAKVRAKVQLTPSTSAKFPLSIQ